GEVRIECAVFDRETRHARINRADIDRSACAETSAASVRSIATFYSEALDVDAFERQRSRSGNWLVIQIVKDRCTSYAKQSRVSSSRPLQCCSVALNGDVREDDRRRRKPERVMRIAIPGSIEGVHLVFEDDREWSAIAL